MEFDPKKTIEPKTIGLVNNPVWYKDAIWTKHTVWLNCKVDPKDPIWTRTKGLIDFDAKILFATKYYPWFLFEPNILTPKYSLQRCNFDSTIQPWSKRYNSFNFDPNMIQIRNFWFLP